MRHPHPYLYAFISASTLTSSLACILGMYYQFQIGDQTQMPSGLMMFYIACSFGIGILCSLLAIMRTVELTGIKSEKSSPEVSQ